jgi:uracil-DNA glycosylase family 4
MPVTGEGKLNALILGEAPGGEEDQRNVQFVGKAGRDLDRDFHKRNVVNCRPTDSDGLNRTPTKTELQCCEHTWRKTIHDLQPLFIILFGGKAVEAFFMNYSYPIRKNLAISRFRHLCIPDPVTKAWVLPGYHPSFAARDPDAEPIFKIDLNYILDKVQEKKKRPEFPDWESRVETLTDFDQVCELLRSILDSKPYIFPDYETSGVRPYAEGHKIWTIGIGGGKKAFAFPYSYPGVFSAEQRTQIAELWKDILTNPDIPKVAQSIQMEESWGRGIFGVETRGWRMCTMNASHIVDERNEWTSLDFQVFINFGYEYGQDIAPFKKASTPNGFNRIHQAPLDRLLLYNGLDSLFCNELWSIRSKDLRDDANLRAYDLFHDGVLTFCDMEESGVNVDVNYYQDASSRLERRLEVLDNKLLRSPEAQTYARKTGKRLNPYSNAQVATLLFKIMGVKPFKATASGKGYSVDQESLQAINIPFTQALLRAKKLRDNKNKYVDGILSWAVDGKLHTNLNLHLVETYRSSSSDPNLHNIPIRDAESMKIVRDGIIPSPGNKILDADYVGHEVRIITCLSGDPELRKTIRSGGDVHHDWIGELELEKYKEYKSARRDIKDSFVFPKFYGAKGVYHYLVEAGYEHLNEMTVQKAEREFERMYGGVMNWHKKLLAFYRSHGYVEMPFGFRRRGYLTYNQIINTPVQGTAFHCIVWSLNRINSVRKEENWETKHPLQIHDDIFFDLYPPEEEHILRVTKRIMTEEILKINKWITVPLEVEFEAAEVNEPWSRKETMTPF